MNNLGVLDSHIGIAILNTNDQPNENNRRVQAALDVKGCMCINRPGGRCKAPIVFDATIPFITCTTNPKHDRAAYEKPYDKITCYQSG